MSSWNSELYLQFANERTQPSIDLIARINLPSPNNIIDLGCGPGNSTQMLRRRWLDADITGLDSSENMIEAAAKAYPHEKWVLADAAKWQAETPFDLVFSNATLQWLPDHTNLFPHLFAQVAEGGALAVQMPMHYESTLRKVALEIAANPEWRHLTEAPANALTYNRPPMYYDILQPLASHIDLWETEYFHIMESPQAIFNWYRATGLRPFFDALESEAQKQRFENLLVEGYSKAYPRQKDGRILFPFRRLFMVAYR